MLFKAVCLYKKNEDFYSIPQFIKDCPDEDIAESNRRYYIEQNMKNKSALMPEIYANSLDLVVVGTFEDSTSKFISYDKPVFLGNLGQWLREGGFYNGEDNA